MGSTPSNRFTWASSLMEVKMIKHFLLTLVICGGILTSCTPSDSKPNRAETIQIENINTRYRVFLPQSTPYSDLGYKWFDIESDSACIWLATIFFNEEGQQVAMLAEIPNCGPLPQDPEANRPVQVKWAQGEAYYCAPEAPITLTVASLTEEPYQTCLAWGDGQARFLLYSTFSEDAIIQLANSLKPSR